MRQDWIEFEGREFDKFIVRPEYITWVAQGGHNSKGEKPTYILVDRMREDGQDLLTINESYEQVKQKVMDAEKVDYSDVVVEHFTKEEYATLYDLVVEELEHGLGKTYLAKLNSIKHRLMQILKEENEQTDN